jgi:2,5-diamino-6-(ribosylamino)-4(3H)-pyrimidinone 5'-phosphate reductase
MNRPFVYVNMAMTVDGKITSTGREYPKFSSRHDKRTMDHLRAEADAVLIGAGTLRADDPPLQVRDPEMQAYRRSLGKPDTLLNVVVTASVEIDPGSRFFRDTTGGKIVVTVEDAPKDRIAAVAKSAEVWKIGRGRVDIEKALRRLSERGVARLLVEGGGDLNWSFAKDDLIDEIYVTIAPALLGGRNAPTLLEGDGFMMASRRPLRLLHLERHEDEIYCRYAVVR